MFWGYYLISNRSVRVVQCGGWNAFLRGVCMLSSCLLRCGKECEWLFALYSFSLPMGWQLVLGVPHLWPKGSWTRLQPPVTPLRDQEGKDRWRKCCLDCFYCKINGLETVVKGQVVCVLNVKQQPRVSTILTGLRHIFVDFWNCRLVIICRPESLNLFNSCCTILLSLLLWTSCSSWWTVATEPLGVWSERNRTRWGLPDAPSPGLHWPSARWTRLNPKPAVRHTETLLACALYKKAAKGNVLPSFRKQDDSNWSLFFFGVFWGISCRTTNNQNNAGLI